MSIYALEDGDRPELGNTRRPGRSRRWGKMISLSQKLIKPSQVSVGEKYINTKGELIEFMCDVAWEISIAAVGLRGFPLRPLPNVYRAVASGRVVWVTGGAADNRGTWACFLFLLK